MKPALNHDEAFEELNALAFDLLDASQRDAVLRHVDECAICREEFESLRATVADLAFAAPAASAAVAGSRGRIRDRLMARAAADRGGSGTPVIPLSLASVPSTPVVMPRKGWRNVEWIAMAASVLLAVSLGALAFSYDSRRKLQFTIDQQTAQGVQSRRAADSLLTVVAMRDSLLAGLTGRNVSVMTLTSSAAKDPYARMFWDRATNTWTLIAHNMPELRPGRTYQLWLVTPKGKISAGTFATRNGEGVVRATYALGDNPLQAIAVTEEPEGGVPQPTGAIVVAAAATGS